MTCDALAWLSCWGYSKDSQAAALTSYILAIVGPLLRPNLESGTFCRSKAQEQEQVNSQTEVRDGLSCQIPSVW